MKISFQLPYHTHWGEDVRILFSDGMEFPLHTRNGEIWRGSLELDPITCPTESTINMPSTKMKFVRVRNGMGLNDV